MFYLACERGVCADKQKERLDLTVGGAILNHVTISVRGKQEVVLGPPPC